MGYLLLYIVISNEPIGNLIILILLQLRLYINVKSMKSFYANITV